MSASGLRKDFYKILRVSRTATTSEIKTAYRQLALSLHPDRHDGCTDKTRLFKEVSEAYNTLVNNDLRREYDLATGHMPSGWYNKNRRRPPPADYRKVYTPHAPPDGKWNDAQRHYDMHYGDGQFHEAMKSAYKRAKRSGDFDYTSPLGKGFTFDAGWRGSASGGINQEKRNPYSKATQGPPVQHYMYEEQKGSLNEANDIMKRKSGVKDKLHERRQQRYAKMQAEEDAKSQPVVPGQKVYKSFNEQPFEGGGGGCSIM